MTSDALLALRASEVVPEEVVRDWLHAIELEFDRLDSELRQAEADADEAERRLEPGIPSDDLADQFAQELNRSLEDLVTSTQRELREALDDAHRRAAIRLAQARADAEQLRGAARISGAHPVLRQTVVPPLSVVPDETIIELRTVPQESLPAEADAPERLDELAPEADLEVVPDTESVAAAHEAFWSESEEVAKRERSVRSTLMAAALPMIAAVLILVALLLWLG